MMAARDKADLPAPVRLDALAPQERRRILTRAQDPRDVDDTVLQQARSIVQDVALRGDDALLEHTKRLDGVAPQPLLLGPEDFQEATRRVAAPVMRALERAARNLRTVAENTRGAPATRIEVERGLVVTEYTTPLARVGAYAPGGRAAYPSSVLMTVVPARAAGVPEVIVATPPGENGRPADAVLAACHVAGATSCLAAGGAQAIAALAHGTDRVPRVDKIVGPGNPWVTAAKRLVHGIVDTDAPAGPSEVIVLADETADPKWVAMDLVAQAEHGAESPCILVTTSQDLADAVARALPDTVHQAARSDTIQSALSDHGAVLVADRLDEAIAFVNEYAPEHLQVMTHESEQVAAAVTTAGTTFIGHWAPVPAGDYLTGANHVLPTGGAARYRGPLGVQDFLVRRTHQSLTRDAARALIDDLDILATAEGLTAHGDSMRIRTRDIVPASTPGVQKKERRP